MDNAVDRVPETADTVRCHILCLCDSDISAHGSALLPADTTTLVGRAGREVDLMEPHVVTLQIWRQGDTTTIYSNRGSSIHE